MSRRFPFQALKLALCRLLVAAFLIAVFWGSPAGAGRAPDWPAPEIPSGPADFNTCARLAIRQSPFLAKSSLEIEIKRLNARDSRSELLPSLYLSSKYYLAQPRNPWEDSPNEFYLSLSTGDYNPLVAWFSLKVHKMILEAATLAHMKAISLALERLGKAFLELEALERLQELQQLKRDLAREHLRYLRERQSLGEVTALEADLAAQEAEVAEAEKESLAASRAKLEEGIHSFLGLPAGTPLKLEVSSSRRQVLGDFDPARARREEGLERSFDVRIKKLTQELQKWNIVLAKMRFLPAVYLAVQNTDPLYQSSSQQGAFFSLGLRFPVFEGFRRLRNITRQETILKQYASEETVTATEFQQKWRELELEHKKALAALKVARTQAEAARLRERQAETLYRAGEKDFAVLLSARQARVKADIEEVRARLEAEVAVLGLRHLSGELVYQFVHEDQFKKPL